MKEYCSKCKKQTKSEYAESIRDYSCSECGLSYVNTNFKEEENDNTRNI